MARKPDGERRVYVLPQELLHRVRQYQTRMSLPSEVEAVRRLLDEALQRRDTVETILDKMIERSKTEKDIKMLAREILSSHPLVKEISFGWFGVKFTLESTDYGKFSNDLKAYQADFAATGDYDEYPSRPSIAEIAEKARQEAEAKRLKDLDDDIPF